MQKLFSPFIFLICFINLNCSKPKSSNSSNVNSNQNLAQAPSANAQYDNSNYGIYKGVIIGSSGTIVLDISNSNDSLSATLIIDGVTHHFFTNQSIQQNQNTSITFVDGNDQFTFTVSSNGNNPTITNLNINGHPNAALLVVKENSTTLVKCFEGTFSGSYSGIFNAVIYGNIIKGISRTTGDLTIVYANGTVNNNQINASGTGSNGAVFVAALNGNNFSGNWSRFSDNSSGSFSGDRTY